MLDGNSRTRIPLRRKSVSDITDSCLVAGSLAPEPGVRQLTSSHPQNVAKPPVLEPRCLGRKECELGARNSCHMKSWGWGSVLGLKTLQLGRCTL